MTEKCECDRENGSCFEDGCYCSLQNKFCVMKSLHDIYSNIRNDFVVYHPTNIPQVITKIYEFDEYIKKKYIP